MERRRGKAEAAESSLQRALQIIEAHDSTHRDIYISTLGQLAGVKMAQNQPSEALRLLQRTGEMLDRTGRGGTMPRLTARQNAAVALSYLGEVRAALVERKIVSERSAEMQPRGQEAVAFAQNYAAGLLRMARPEEALHVLDGVCDRARRDGQTYVLEHVLLTSGSTFIELGRLPEADAALAEGAKLVAGGLGEKSVAAAIESARARLDLARGDLESAHRHSDRALELAGYHTAKPERSLAEVLRRAAQIAVAQGASERAEQFARDALAISEPIARGPDTSADVGEALLLLAQAQMLAGAHSDTRAILERAVRCLSNGLTPDHPLTAEARALLAQLSSPHA
jgi:tetratricopeptide (TPR) repeat protein